MIITSGKVIVCTGLAALALVACGGDGTVDGADPTSTGMSMAAGGSGGQGGSMEMKEVDQFNCELGSGEVLIHATRYGQEDKNVIDYEYIPKELTVKVGQIVEFTTDTSTQNMTSGSPPYGDGKFKTPQGLCQCLRFNVPGTYPFFSINLKHEPPEGDRCEGVITVQ